MLTRRKEVKNVSTQNEQAAQLQKFQKRNPHKQAQYKPSYHARRDSDVVSKGTMKIVRFAPRRGPFFMVKNAVL